MLASWLNLIGLVLGIVGFMSLGWELLKRDPGMWALPVARRRIAVGCVFFGFLGQAAGPIIALLQSK
jgi:hypothetical protein